MPHEKDWHIVCIWLELGFEHGGYVSEDGRGGACEAAGCGGDDGAAPSALVEAEGLDPAGGEGGKECIIGIDVIGEAVDEDEDCGGWEVGRLRWFS